MKRIFIFLVSLNFLILNAQDFDGQFTVSPSCGDATSSEVYTITNNSSQTLEFQILSEYEEINHTPWLMESFSDANHSNLASTTYIDIINQNWGPSSPAGCPQDYFSVRYSGDVYIDQSATYYFRANCCDNVETVYIDGNYAFTMNYHNDTDSYYLSEGWHYVEVDFVEYTGMACATMLYSIDPNGYGSSFRPSEIVLHPSYSWISFYDEPLTIPSGESQDVLIIVNGDGFEEGNYEGAFYIQSSDEGADVLEVPVTMEVVGCPGCTDELACNFDEGAGFNDGSCEYSCHDNGDYSLSFDGVDDYVEIPNIHSSTFTSDFTIYTRVNFYDFTTNPYPYIIHGSSFINFHGLGPAYGSDMGKVGFYMAGTGGDSGFMYSNTILEENTFYDIHITYADGGANLYINGQLENSAPLSYEDVDSNIGSLYVGGPLPHMSSEHFLDGEIDKVMIWGRALDQHEINLSITDFQHTDLSNDILINQNYLAGQGGIAYDHSGDQNHGTIYGATWVENIYGCTDELACNYNSEADFDNGSCDYSCYENGDYSLSFDGIDDYISCQNNLSGEYSAITIEARVNISEYPSDYGKIVDIGNQNNDRLTFQTTYQNGIDYGIEENNAGIDGMAQYYEADHILQKYIDIVAVWDGTSHISLYIDGNLVSTNDIPPTLSSLFIEPSSLFMIGSRFTVENHFNGLIDRLRIWEVPLSQEDILILNEIDEVSNEGLIAYYKFNSGLGDILYDHSGNQNHGTIYGATWVENIYGCTDELACNYNSDADFDDGSCNEGYVVLWDECYNIEETTYLHLGESGLIGSIPPEIGNLVNLTNLSLNDNELTGSIPLEIGDLTNLNILNLYGNQLSGEIPLGVFNIINLHTLWLGDNELTGSIPSEIGNLINLTELGLGGNQLTGSIPLEIGNLENLIGLTLSRNQLIGPIPTVIENFPNLEVLYLNDNQLSGAITINFNQLQNLNNLNLSNNSLSGLFPENICELSLDEFHISYNNFCLPYPGCLTEEQIGNQDISECMYSYTIDLHSNANLVSFMALPDDNYVGTVLESIDGEVTGIIGQGVASSPHPTFDWVGSLTSIEYPQGYWIVMSDPGILTITSPDYPGSINSNYLLNTGANLISFPFEGPYLISDVLPDEIEPYITDIIGEGQAATQNPALGWIGSLSTLQGSKGYWFKVSEPIEFQFTTPDSREAVSPINKPKNK